MTGLVAFLQARLDELERTVVAEHGGPGFFWASGDRALTTEVPITGPDGQVWPQWRDVPPKAVFWLADIKAKRELIDDLLDTLHWTGDGWYGCDGLGDSDDDTGAQRMVGPCTCGVTDDVERRLRLLAAPFAGHPDFDPAWTVPMS